MINMQHLKDINAKPYMKFLWMLLASFIAMYITMYLNTYQLDHVYFSLTRFYMTCLGISAMAIIMLLFMMNMYRNKKKNLAIIFWQYRAIYFCAYFSANTDTNWRYFIYESDDSASFNCHSRK